MAPDKSVIREKLVVLLGYIAELEPHVSISLDEYLASSVIRRAVERLFQIIVEAIVDIADLILTDSGHEPPAAARESLVRLQELGILSAALADRLIQSVGVRNRPVHQYDRIDNARVHGGLRLFLRRPCFLRLRSGQGRR